MAFWQSSSVMTDTERVRIEIAFDGQQVLSVLVPQQTAEDLERSLAGDHDTAYTFEADDGRYTIVVTAGRLREALRSREPRRLRRRRLTG